MFSNPDLMAAVAHEHIRGLIDEAASYRQGEPTRTRRQRWPGSQRPVKAAVGRSNAGRLVTCEPNGGQAR